MRYDKKLNVETRRALHEQGYFVSSLWQPPSKFPDDGRRLKNVAIATDPWVAQIFYPLEWLDSGQPCSWWPLFIQWGEGATADAAVQDALRKATGLEGRYRKLAAAFEYLGDTIHARTARLAA